MVRAVARQDHNPIVVPAPAVVRADDLERELVGLAAAQRERDDRIVDRQQAREGVRELDCLRVRNAGIERDELELLDLSRHPEPDLPAAVPDLRRTEVAAGIEKAMARVVPHVRAFPAHDHSRVLRGIALLERTEIGEEVTNGMASTRSAIGGRQYLRHLAAPLAIPWVDSKSKQV